MTRAVKVYLDNCCYNRPYDNQLDPRVYMESQAKMLIQDMIHNGRFTLVVSSVLDYEIEKSPFYDRKAAIASFIRENQSIYVNVADSDSISSDADQIMKTGVKFYDAYHVACAVYAGCDYFLTTDKRLLRYGSDRITMINPVDFIRELEGIQ